MFLKINVNKENGTYVYVLLWSSSGDSASCHLNPLETSVFIPDLLNFSCLPLKLIEFFVEQPCCGQTEFHTALS